MGEASIPAVPRRDGLAIAAAAFVVYVACGREAWHGIDMLALFNELHRGATSHPYYGFFPALLVAMQAVVAPFGGGIYHGGLVLGALGTAIGVGCTHAAAHRLGMPRGAAAFAALVLATLPGLVYFAVTVEVHGHVLAFCGLVWLLMARWTAAPGLWRAVAIGAALALAWLAHPMAAMSGAAMVPIAALASPAVSVRETLLGCLLAGVTLLLFLLLRFVALPGLGLLGTQGGSEVLAAFTRFQSVTQAAGISSLGVTLTREWLVPFFPASIVVVGLVVRRRARAAALATLAATVPFVLVSWWILWIDECGAYVTMAAGPMALTVAAHVRSTGIRVLYLAGAVAAAIWFSQRLQVTPQAMATAEAVQAAVGDRAMAWLVGDGAGPDGQVWLTRFPSSRVVVLADLLTMPPAMADATLARLATEIEAWERSGVPTIVTSTTIDTLAGFAPVHAPSRVVHAWLSARRGEGLGEAGGVRVFAVRGH